jgi:hypothetical protein
MLMSSLFLLAAVATAAAAPLATAPDAWLDRPVEEVYVQKGDVLIFLPELLTQLDIPAAGIDLGFINSRNVIRKDLAPGAPNPEVVDWRPERQVGPLEMKKGTVRQALDELVRQRPELAWRNENGVLLISSSAAKGSVVQPILDCRLPEFKADKKPLDRAAAEMESAIQTIQPTIEKTVWWNMMLWRQHPVLEPRQTLSVPVTLNKNDATVHQILTDLVRQVPGAFWVAYDEGEDPVGAPGCPGVITLSRHSCFRRELSLEALIRCLDGAYAPLHGSERVGDRVDEAERELRRRFYFNAVEVRQTLLKAESLPRQMQSATEKEDLQGVMRWACSLRDVQLTGALLDLVPMIKKPDNRYKCLLGTEFTLFQEPELRPKCLALWNRLLEDEDAKVRQKAKELIGWAKDVPEAKP